MVVKDKLLSVIIFSMNCVKAVKECMPSIMRALDAYPGEKDVTFLDGTGGQTISDFMRQNYPGRVGSLMVNVASAP
jgi:hypothetical protein